MIKFNKEVLMIKFTYKGVKYDGLIIFPYDANSNDNELFFREYSGIVAKGLLDQEKWIPPIKQDNLNKLIPNNDGTSKAKIPTLDGIETLLFCIRQLIIFQKNESAN